MDFSLLYECEIDVIHLKGGNSTAHFLRAMISNHLYSCSCISLKQRGLTILDLLDSSHNIPKNYDLSDVVAKNYDLSDVSDVVALIQTQCFKGKGYVCIYHIFMINI
jgi:hypothetical protein